MKARILVADDSATIQKVVELTLSRVGVELIQARSANEAMQKAREEKPDLMLIDHAMPDQSGQDLCAALRQDAQLASVPIIFMTGASAPVDEEEARRAGATDMVAKPFESQVLIGKVKQLLRVPMAEQAALADVESQPGDAALVLEPSGELGETITLPADVMGDSLAEMTAQDPAGADVPTYDLPVTEGEELPLEAMVSEDAPASSTPGVGEMAFQDMAAAVGMEAPGVRTREERILEPAPAPPQLREAQVAPPGAQPLAVPADLVETLAREVAERVASHIVRELRSDLLERVDRLLWEVVPDLAEQLITQEIQRIRDLVEGKK
ncbi:MAG: response regulator [Candidatus Methylomirabilales bacterium]